MYIEYIDSIEYKNISRYLPIYFFKRITHIICYHGIP